MGKDSLKNNQAGFTLTEIIVSLVVVSILVASAAILIIQIGVINTRARNLALVNAAAENKIEELRNSGFINLTDGTYDFSAELTDELHDPKTATYEVSGPTVSVKEVKITINYYDAGTTNTRVYVTQIGELGVGQY